MRFCMKLLVLSFGGKARKKVDPTYRWLVGDAFGAIPETFASLDSVRTAFFASSAKRRSFRRNRFF